MLSIEDHRRRSNYLAAGVRNNNNDDLTSGSRLPLSRLKVCHFARPLARQPQITLDQRVHNGGKSRVMHVMQSV